MVVAEWRNSIAPRVRCCTGTPSRVQGRSSSRCRRPRMRPSRIRCSTFPRWLRRSDCGTQGLDDVLHCRALFHGAVRRALQVHDFPAVWQEIKSNVPGIRRRVERHRRYLEAGTTHIEKVRGDASGSRCGHATLADGAFYGFLGPARASSCGPSRSALPLILERTTRNAAIARQVNVMSTRKTAQNEGAAKKPISSAPATRNPRSDRAPMGQG